MMKKTATRIKVAEEAIRVSRLGAEQEKRWGRVRLLGERRYGELLGPAENHGPATVTSGHGSTDSDRKERERARKVAAVPDGVFAAYVEQAKAPTRAGLLRLRKAPRLRRKRLPRPGRSARKSRLRRNIARWFARSAVTRDGGLATSGCFQTTRRTTLLNECGSCGEDFGSVSAFDAHRVGRHAYTHAEGLAMDPPREDGRRCLMPSELTGHDWSQDSRGRWRQPLKNGFVRFTQPPLALREGSGV